MNLTESDIRRAVGEASFHRGRNYQQERRVKSLTPESDRSISGIVAGSANMRYTVSIRLSKGGKDGPAVAGECSCPVEWNCKHVAAVLLEARQRGLFAEAAIPKSKAPTGPRPPPPEPKLDPPVALWLAELETAVSAPNEHHQGDAGQRLFYVLGKGRIHNGHAEIVTLQLQSARLLKSGDLSPQASPFTPTTIYHAVPPKYLLESDHRIIREALRIQPRASGGQLQAVLASEEGAALLAEIVATGRARWGSVDGPALQPGAARRGVIEWTGDGHSNLLPRLRLEDDGPMFGTLVMAAHPPLHVEPRTGVIGPVETGLPPKVAFRMLAAPPLPPAQAALVSARLSTRDGVLARVSPPTLHPVRHVTTKPVPKLRLRPDLVPDMTSPQPRYYSYTPVMTVAGRADVALLYDGIEVAYETPGETVSRLDGLLPVQIRRDREAERAAIVRLFELGFHSFADLHPLVGRKAGKALGFAGRANWCQFLYVDAPTLREEGWVIEIASDFPVQVVRGDGVFATDIRESSGIDWFEFDLGIMVDGERQDLIGPLIDAITHVDDIGGMVAGLAAEGANLSLRLDETRFLTIPAARLKPYLDMLLQLLSGFAFRERPATLRFSRLDAAHLGLLEEEAAGTGAIWRGGEKVRALGARLTQSGRIPDVDLPDTFKAVLRPYQARGLAWLDFLRSAGLGGILADDMGLGKTVQALALVACEKAAGRLDSPALVVAPTSLMINWQREAEKFAPDLKVLVLQGFDRKGKFDVIDDADLVLSTYPLIQRDHAELKKREWHLLLLDEAQTIKNPDATTTRLIRGMKARHRFCLTGTPLENHLGELWSLFEFIAPGFLGDIRSFNKIWRTPIEKQGNAVLARALANRIKPFLLRRRKDEVAADLPPKTEIVERIDFGAAQSEIYESIRLAMHDKVFAALAEKGLARSRIVVLDALLKLRQVCCDPRLVALGGPAAAKAGSAKLERLMEMVAELRAEGRRILIFSQFTSMLDIIRPRLDAAGVTYSLLTGKTKDRAGAVNQFQQGKAPVFLVSLKAGGVGLNLTAADTVILYDPWWNPAVESQAIDRAHRIGQDKPVFVHKLVVTGTIEEKIEVLKERKAALAAGLFDPDGTPTEAMTEDDLKILFDM